MYKTFFDKTNKTWNGYSQLSIFNPKISIGYALLDALQRNRDRIGQISDNNGLEMYNRDIRLQSIRVAQNLMNLGYTKSDVFSFYAKSSHQLAPVVFGSLIVGAAVNPLDPLFKKNEVCHMLNLTKPSVMFCDIENLPTLEDALTDLQMEPLIYVFGHGDGIRSVEQLFCETGNEDCFLPPDIGDGTVEIAAILCSSGTTGLSKGVCLSHAALLYQIYLLNFNAHDTILTFSSIYWMSGFGYMLAGTLHESVRVITTDPFTPQRMLSLIEKYRVTVLIAAPAHLALILKSPEIERRDLSSVWFFMCGGAAVHDQLCQRMKKYLPNGDVYVVYGISEAAGIISVSYPEARPGSVGQLACGTCVKVLDDDGNKCGIGQQGEICLRMRYDFLGYYGNKEETTSTIDENGYIHSGDVGYFDDDGFLYLVDRKKDILKYRNYQISPSEIENVVLGLEGIKNVCVVGIPDMECTDLPAAVIVKSDESCVTEKEIYNIVEERLSDAKRLRGGIYFVQSLPLTPSGKVLRREVKTMAIKLYNEENNTKL